MDLGERLERESRRRKYIKKAEKYENAAKELRNYAETAKNYITACEQNLAGINSDLPNSYGEVIDNFKDGVDMYSKKISNVIGIANSCKSSVEIAASQAEWTAERYYRMADNLD